MMRLDRESRALNAAYRRATRLTKPMMIEALEQVQHFCPPRPSRQEASVLAALINGALASERYGDRMRAALADVRFRHGRQA